MIKLIVFRTFQNTAISSDFFKNRFVFQTSPWHKPICESLHFGEKKLKPWQECDGQLYQEESTQQARVHWIETRRDDRTDKERREVKTESAEERPKPVCSSLRKRKRTSSELFAQHLMKKSGAELKASTETNGLVCGAEKQNIITTSRIQKVSREYERQEEINTTFRKEMHWSFVSLSLLATGMNFHDTNGRHTWVRHFVSSSLTYF